MDLYLPPVLFYLLVSVSISACIHWQNSFFRGIYVLLGIVTMLFFSMFTTEIKQSFSLRLEKTRKVTLSIFFGTLSLPIRYGLAPMVLGVIKLYGKSFYRMMWFICSVAVPTAGVIVVRKGNFTCINEKKNGIGDLVIASHRGFMDYLIAVLFMGYKNEWKVVVGSNLLTHKVFASFIKRVGIILIRDDDRSKALVAVQIRSALNAGYNVLVFPGAGRDRFLEEEGIFEERKFVVSPFSIACKLHARVILIAISGTGRYCPANPNQKNSAGVTKWEYIKILFKEKFPDYSLLCPGKVTVELVEVIETNPNISAEALSIEVHDKIYARVTD